MPDDNIKNDITDDSPQDFVELTPEEANRLRDIIQNYYTNVSKLYEEFLKNINMIRKRQEQEKLKQIKEVKK